MFLEASEELSLDSPQTDEANEVNHEKEAVLSGPLAEPVDIEKEAVLSGPLAEPVDDKKEAVLSGPLAEPVDEHSHESSSNDPPRLSVDESAVSAPIPKSQSVPEVMPAAKQRLGAKVHRTCSLLLQFFC